MNEPECWDKIRQHAIDQGLCIVQHSARHYLVIRIDLASGNLFHTEDNDRFTYLSGSKVHGPATWEDCRAFVLGQGQKVPEA